MEDQTIEDQLAAELDKLGVTASQEEEKHNTHRFLHDVATAEDTLKLGNLKEEEVGIPTLSVRTLKELQLYSEEIAGEKEWGGYFDKRAEILTSTSLSKDAKLIDLAVIKRSEVANVSKPRRKESKSWFKKKEPGQV